MSRLARAAGVIAVFALIALGVFVWPESLLEVEEGDEGLLRQAAGFLAGLLYLFIWIAVPLLLLLAVFGSEATGRSVTGFLTALIWLVGLGFPVVIVGASVGSTNEQFVMSCLKTLALFLMVLGGRELSLLLRGAGDAWALRIACAAALLLVGFSAWSLISAAAAILSARDIAAGDRPYCIADTRDPDAPYRPITSLFALRGVDLVVEKSGVEASARDYFHAVLYRPGGPQPAYWNWSASHFRFEPIERSALSASVVLPEVPCDARPRYLEDLL